MYRFAGVLTDFCFFDYHPFVNRGSFYGRWVDASLEDAIRRLDRAAWNMAVARAPSSTAISQERYMDV